MTNKTNILSLLALASLLTLTNSCAGTQVTRTRADAVTDLSGRWNDTDSRLVAETLIKKFFNHRWLESFREEHATPSAQYGKRKPIVLISEVINKSHEHIESDTFIKDMEDAIVEDGRVRIVANSVFRERLRKERADQQKGFVSKETQKRFGRELGADYIMYGTINTIVDATGDDQVVFYQVNLQMAHVETGELAWSSSHKMKKFLGKGRRGYRKYGNKIPPTAYRFSTSSISLVPAPQWL